MLLVTAREMQAIDRRTIDGGFVPSLTLMENAGQGATRAVFEWLRERPGRVEILCGKGNNGGDGLVMARLLHAQGIAVRVHLTHPPESLSPDARANYDRLAGVPVRRIPEALPEFGPVLDPRSRRAGAGAIRIAVRSGRPLAENVRLWLAELRAASVCVDALLGTGVGEDLKGRLAAVVDALNACSRRTLAVDIPSGVDGNTGRVCGTAVWADRTVTFGLPKLGLVVHPGRERAGELVVADIGFPADLVQGLVPDRHWVDAARARTLLPRLAPTAHKYERGVVVVVAGSRDFPGAAALAALAALRSGAGLVHLVVPVGIRTLLQSKLTEVIVHGAPETPDGTFASEGLALPRLLERADAVAVGPGVGTAPATQQWLRGFLATLPLPAVVDADAIPAVEGPKHAGPRIVTPHAGELERWSALPTRDVLERMAAAVQTSTDRGVVVVAKGAPTIVASPAGRVEINASGHAGLGTAGSGDVLTGILAGLLAQGVAPADAAALGVYLHGRSAELAVERGSPRSLLAGDLLGALGPAYRELESSPPD